MGIHGPASLLICSLILLFNLDSSSSAPLQDAWQLNWLFEKQDNLSNENYKNSHNKNGKWDFGFNSDKESEIKLSVHNSGEVTWPFDWPLNDQISVINNESPVREDTIDWNFEWSSKESNENYEQIVASENSLTSLPFDWPFKNHNELKNEITKLAKENMWFNEFPMQIIDTKSEPTTEYTKSNTWTFGWPFDISLSGATTSNPKPSMPNFRETKENDNKEDFSTSSSSETSEESDEESDKTVIDVEIDSTAQDTVNSTLPALLPEITTDPIENKENDNKEDFSTSSSSESSEESEEESDETVIDVEIDSTGQETVNSTLPALLPEVTTVTSDFGIYNETDYLEENLNGTDTVLYDAVDYDEGSGEEDVTTIKESYELDVTTETTEVVVETEQADIEITTEVVYSDN